MEDADSIFGAFTVCGYWLSRKESGAVTEESFVGGHAQSVVGSVVVDRRRD